MDTPYRRGNYIRFLYMFSCIRNNDPINQGKQNDLPNNIVYKLEIKWSYH